MKRDIRLLESCAAISVKKRSSEVHVDIFAEVKVVVSSSKETKTAGPAGDSPLGSYVCLAIEEAECHV